MASGSNMVGFDDGNMDEYDCEDGWAEILEYLKGPSAAILLNQYFGNNVAMATLERTRLILRVQYLELFTMHYPVCTGCTCARHFYLCKYIAKHAWDLRRQIKNCRVMEYIVTAKHIIDVIEVLELVMRGHGMFWFFCACCHGDSDRFTTLHCPLIKCLSIRYATPHYIMAMYLGLPPPCNWQP